MLQKYGEHLKKKSLPIRICSIYPNPYVQFSVIESIESYKFYNHIPTNVTADMNKNCATN